MKIIISGKEYPLFDAVSNASIANLYHLKTKLGVSIKTINKTFEQMDALVKNPDFEPLDLLDDADLMLNLQGMVWLARRAAGETCTIEEAGDIPFNDVELEGDEDEEAEEDAVDPKVPDSAPADDPEPETPTITT